LQYILDSVLLALEANPDRKFIYVEQAFFQRWWREADDSLQARMQKLYASGQLDFVNGGWCMYVALASGFGVLPILQCLEFSDSCRHDEAAAHAVDMIDQTTVGHRYLKEQFGATPSVGWQIGATFVSRLCAVCVRLFCLPDSRCVCRPIWPFCHAGSKAACIRNITHIVSRHD
jgi:hypothetical protein